MKKKKKFKIDNRVGDLSIFIYLILMINLEEKVIISY